MRPWGPIEWLLPKLPRRGNVVRFLGCLASEERCLATPLLAHSAGAGSLVLIRVDDPPSRYSKVITTRIRQRQALLKARGLQPAIEGLSLFAPDQAIADVFESSFCGDLAAKVTLWLDITSLPKRFFFFLIKLAMSDRRVDNLLVLYSQPAPGRYTREHLAEDPEGVRPLPGFGPVKGEPDTLILALGFEALGLPSLLGEYRDRQREIRALLPFPPGQPYSRRIWSTLLNSGVDARASDIRRVNAVDTFDTYEQLVQLASPTAAEVRERPPALAPYGPKPVSVGMCMYSLETGAPVFYTQPRTYHPDYTIGIGKTWAYCLKLGGRKSW